MTIGNLQLSLFMKELGKSVSIWRKRGKHIVPVLFF